MLWNSYFWKITNLIHSSLKKSFFPGDLKVRTPSRITNNISQGVFFVMISCQRVCLEARTCLPKFCAKFGWTFWGEFLLKPFILWIEGSSCSENSWEGFGWFFAIERLFWSPNVVPSDTKSSHTNSTRNALKELFSKSYEFHACHAGGNFRIHDLFGRAWISRICNAYFVPNSGIPKYGNTLGNSLPVGPAQQTT